MIKSLPKSHFSRSVSSTSHSLMLRYLNTAGKKLSISLKKDKLLSLQWLMEIRKPTLLRWEYASHHCCSAPPSLKHSTRWKNIDVCKIMWGMCRNKKNYLPKKRKSKILEAGSIWPKINKISSSMKAWGTTLFIGDHTDFYHVGTSGSSIIGFSSLWFPYGHTLLFSFSNWY